MPGRWPGSTCLVYGFTSGGVRGGDCCWDWEYHMSLEQPDDKAHAASDKETKTFKDSLYITGCINLIIISSIP